VAIGFHAQLGIVMLPDIGTAQRKKLLNGIAVLRRAHRLQILSILEHAIGCENGCVRVGLTTVVCPGVTREQVEDVETIFSTHAHREPAVLFTSRPPGRSE